MRHICAFCKKELAPPDGDDEKVSHGICTPCYNHAKASLGVDLKEFLNMLDYPVLLVDNDVRVLSSNIKAAQFTEKSQEVMTGQYGGEVFECEHAKLPEGCGKTVHCSACVIRNSVNEAYQTGAYIERRPATLHQGIPGHSDSVDLLITARKAGDVVLLVVEPVS